MKNIFRRIKWKVINKTFAFWQMLGFHITPVHFYQPIPDTRELGAAQFEKKTGARGIEFNENNQLDLLSLLANKYRNEFIEFEAGSDKNGYFVNNSEFGPGDAEMLYYMVRELKPKSIIEIGSGYSTSLMLSAILKNRNEGNQCKLTVIDPYPKLFVRELGNSIRLIDKKVQDIEMGEFKKLGKNDILFIDSSHILKIGSDVHYEFLEIIPEINSGVFIHVHDIFMPAEYPKKWILKDHLFYNEQYILQAFLSFNDEYKIIWSANYMHQRHGELLQKGFCFYRPNVNSPGSFWFKRR